MKHCTKCGKELGVEDIFCSSCGTKVNGDIENNTQDQPIQADLKIEVTNATAEKAFKKIGETISSSKETVKATTGFVKRIFIPVAVLLIIVGAAAVIYETKIYEEENLSLVQEQDQEQDWLQGWEEEKKNERTKRLNEKRGCITKQFDNYIKHHTSVWKAVRYQCDLTHKDIEYLQKKFGSNLEKF